MNSNKALETSILAACLCAAVGCAEEEPPFQIPLGQTLPPLNCRFQITYDELPDPMFVWPAETLDGSLHLEVAQDGAVTGVLAVNAQQPDRQLLSYGAMTAVAGEVQGGDIVFSPVEFLSEQSATYRAEELRITLEDADGDGQADSGSGSVSGRWMGLFPEYNAFYEESAFTASLSITDDDDDAERARLYASRQGPISGVDVLPQAMVELAFSEPVREIEAASMIRLAADNVPLASSMATNAMNGLLTHVTLTPVEPLPFNAKIIVDQGRLTDLAGNHIDEARPIYTIGDYGSILNNAGFEGAISAWFGEGQAEVERGTFGLEPVEGERHGVVRSPWSIGQMDSALAGYLDVPDNAAALALSVTVLFERFMDDDYMATITLYAAGREPMLVFDSRTQQIWGEPCVECGANWERIGLRRHEIDLREHRGTRIWLIAATHALVVDSRFNPVVAMAIDDLRIIEEEPEEPPAAASEALSEQPEELPEDVAPASLGY